MSLPSYFSTNIFVLISQHVAQIALHCVAIYLNKANNLIHTSVSSKNFTSSIIEKRQIFVTFQHLVHILSHNIHYFIDLSLLLGQSFRSSTARCTRWTTTAISCPRQCITFDEILRIPFETYMISMNEIIQSEIKEI